MIKDDEMRCILIYRSRTLDGPPPKSLADMNT